MSKHELGLIGLSVMGQNLALNIASNHSLTVYNRTQSRTQQFMEERVKQEKTAPPITAAYSLKKLVQSLEKPRKLLLLIKAGKPVDLVIEKLLPLLEEGDIIIDGGNSYFRDTARRYRQLEGEGIRYLGMGVSGGEYGALHGPSLMPGGDESAYRESEDILKDIAARTDKGPCVSYLGPKAAGHYVKMVHNGIEYGIMELISEVYDIMRKYLRKKPAEMSRIFQKWNRDFDSYLMEITYKILNQTDPTTGDTPLIDKILDKAGQKGTGKWSVQDALELGIPIPTINAGVNARLLSALKETRVQIYRVFNQHSGNPKDNGEQITEPELLPRLKQGLYAGTIIAYAEGFELLRAASHEYEFGLDFTEIARVWEDGCIIRSGLLEPIQEAFSGGDRPLNLITSSPFRKQIQENIGGLRTAVTTANHNQIPVPALRGSLDYFDSLKSRQLPANLIQAQRDYFGAHTYQRIDREGTFHTQWQEN